MSNKQSVTLVGILQDDGSVRNIKAFLNPTWAVKYSQNAGEFARTAVVEVEFTTNPVQPKAPKVVVAKASKKLSAVVAEAN
jgi:hypothetical protein